MEIALIPAGLLRSLCADPARRPWLNFAASSTLVMLFLVFCPPALLAHIPHACLAQKVFGLPCPGCGITTSLFALAQLRVSAAIAANPAGVFVAISLLFQMGAGSLGLVYEGSRPICGRVIRYSGTLTLLVLGMVWALRVNQVALL